MRQVKRGSMHNPLTHIHIFPYILQWLPNETLILKARVSKAWHAKIREILRNRPSFDINIASTLHNRRWSSQDLKANQYPIKIIAKRDPHLYVAYSNNTINRWDLRTGKVDKSYPIAYMDPKLKLRGNFLFCYGSFSHLHFTHVTTQKTFFKVGNYYNAWKDWVIFLTVHIGLFHYATKEMHVLHCNVAPNSRIISVIDNKLVTYHRNNIYLWDLNQKKILQETAFFGIFFSIKRREEVMIWHIMRSRTGARYIVFRSLESPYTEWVKVNNNVHIIRSEQALFTLDKPLQILSGTKLNAQVDKDFKSHDIRIYQYSPYVITSDARIYRIRQGSLKLIKQYRGRFYPDGTLTIIKRDRVVVLNLNQHPLMPAPPSSLLTKLVKTAKAPFF